MEKGYELEPWEKDLPPSLRSAIEEFIEGEKQDVSYYDCLWGELYGSINANQWDFTITKEQADYLRKKYLFRSDEEEENMEIREKDLTL